MSESPLEHAPPRDVICYRSSLASRSFPLAILGFITAIGLTGIPYVGGDDGIPPLFMTGWLLLVGWSWYNLLVKVSFEVTLWPDSGRVQFRSAVRRTETSIGEVSAITSAPFGGMTVVFHHREGKTQVLRTLDGMSDLVYRIRQANPGVKTRRV